MGDIPVKDMAKYNEEVRESRLRTPQSDNPAQEQRGKDTKAMEQKQHELDNRQTDIVETIKGAWKFDTLTGAMITTGIDDFNQKDDPDFDPYKYDDFVPMDQTEKDLIAETLNPEHYAAVRDTLEQRRTYQQDIASLGFVKALPLQFVAEFGNLTNYMIPGGAMFTKLNGIKKLAFAGAYGAGVNIAETAGLDAIYNDRTATEYLSTAALGMGFGMGLAHIGSVPKAKTDVEGKIARASLMSEGYARHHMAGVAKEQVGSAGAARIRPDLDADAKIRMRNDKLDVESEGATATFIEMTEGNIPQQSPKWSSKLGIQSQGYTSQTSANPMMRKAGYDLVEKPETGLDHIDSQTAATYIAMDNKRMASLYARPTEELYHKFKKTDPENINDFGDLAFRKLHDEDIIDSITPEGNKVLDDWVKVYKNSWEHIVREGHAAGVEEFADLDASLKYKHRNYDPAAILELSRVHGEDAVVDLFAKGLRGDGGADKVFQTYVDAAVKKMEIEKATPEYKASVKAAKEGAKKIRADLDKQMADLRALDNSISKRGQVLAARVEKLQRKLYHFETKNKLHWEDFTDEAFNLDEITKSMARSTYNRISRRGISPTADANMFTSANRSLMKDTIMVSDMSSAQKSAMLHIMDTQGRDVKGKFTKSRMSLDMSASMKSAATGENIRITDMFNTDAGAATHMGFRYWQGRTGMAFQGNQYKSMDAMDKFVEDMKAHGLARDMKAEDINYDVNSFKIMQKQLLAQPIEDMDDKFNQLQRNIRKATSLNVMNKLVFPQMGETGRAIAAIGVRNTLSQIPIIGKLMGDIKGGRFNTELLNDLQDNLLGRIGDDYIYNSPIFRSDDLGHKSGKVESTLNWLGHKQGKIFGWHAVHTAQKKMVINGLSQKWYRQITDGTMPDVIKNAMGLDNVMERRLKNNMQTFATMEDVQWGSKGRVRNLNIQKWEPDVARYFGQAIERKASNAIQEILIGEIPQFMTKELGKTLTQFRSFNIASLGKQGFRDVNIMKGNKEPVSAFLFTCMTAGMASMARVAWDASTDANPKEYAEENLTVANLSRQALIYNGQVGTGVDIVDLAGSVLSPDEWNPVMGRQGFTAKGVEGFVPAIGYANKVIKGARGAIDLAIPGDTKADLRAITGFAPYRNSMYGDLILKTIEDKDK